MNTPLRLLTGALVSFAFAAPVAWAEDAAAVPAVWQKHEYSFVFMGFTSTYSCDGLAGALQRLLLRSGARADAKAYPRPCSRGDRPQKLAGADLTFYTLAPAGPGVEGEPAMGTWQPVHFATHDPRDMQDGDCELVEEFSKTLLPMFTTRAVDARMACVPHQSSFFRLSYEVLAPLPKTAAPGAAAGSGAPTRPLYAYPQKGQSAEQQSKDRDECHASAVAATHLDPDARGAPAPSAAQAEDFRRAEAACLAARGYSVR
jgi:hypothetical protein